MKRVKYGLVEVKGIKFNGAYSVFGVYKVKVIEEYNDNYRVSYLEKVHGNSNFELISLDRRNGIIPKNKLIDSYEVEKYSLCEKIIRMFKK